MRQIILASASPRRQELLKQAGLPFEVRPSNVEEVITSTRPAQVVEELSLQKCREVFNRTEGEILVLGADTVVSVKEKILGKPADKADACSMLTILQGTSHQVYTGVTLLYRKDGKESCRTFHEKTDVSFYSMTDKEIEEYVSTGEPMDKAGAYGIQGKSAVFIEKINGDYATVVGLPVARVYQELKLLGIDIKEWKL